MKFKIFLFIFAWALVAKVSSLPFSVICTVFEIAIAVPVYFWMKRILAVLLSTKLLREDNSDDFEANSRSLGDRTKFYL